ncbi:hypothetical protein LIER_33784 [Lithospermum erythrorhizon]|uniref:Uncharacterized protein n=1 Tax=Lithospermum erythrorhizon TaxID=34254 RepID=A0AAV3S2L3_LITER
MQKLAFRLEESQRGSDTLIKIQAEEDVNSTMVAKPPIAHGREDANQVRPTYHPVTYMASSANISQQGMKVEIIAHVDPRAKVQSINKTGRSIAVMTREYNGGSDQLKDQARECESAMAAKHRVQMGWRSTNSTISTPSLPSQDTVHF